jgi:formate hydrogenlyase subunit 6/NADH:ubiquinone oxidoreductase subunit I
MPLWFARGLRRGVVTTRYPARPDSSAAALPTPPAFRPDALTRELADRLCLICPSWALTRNGDVLIFDAGACTACGRCQEAAPAAVTASGEFELAATDPAHLVKHIPLLGKGAQ